VNWQSAALRGHDASFWQDDDRYLDTYWQAIPGIWVHGDLALRTVAGDFFMMGRSDDTLKVAGKRLGPAEVEEVVLELRRCRGCRDRRGRCGQGPEAGGLRRAQARCLCLERGTASRRGRRTWTSAWAVPSGQAKFTW
jgi:acyl-CoA synthetase (AMP-forming)/AMP-acid ligase II